MGKARGCPPRSYFKCDLLNYRQNTVIETRQNPVNKDREKPTIKTRQNPAHHINNSLQEERLREEGKNGSLRSAGTTGKDVKSSLRSQGEDDQLRQARAAEIAALRKSLGSS